MTKGLTPDEKRAYVGLPPRPFFYTLEQISELTCIPIKRMEAFLYYDRRTLGIKKASHLMVRNLGSPGGEIIWRVAENEFIRWLKAHGIRSRDRFYVKD